MNMKPILKPILFAGLSLLAFACGKSDAEKFADSYCAEVAKCCVQSGQSGSGQLCHLAFAGGSYDAKAGEACLAETRAEVAAGTFCSEGNAAASACDAVVKNTSQGSKKPGESCDVDSNCASSNEGKVVCASHYTGTDWIHKCQLQIHGTVGDNPCLGTQDGETLSHVGSSSDDVIARGYVCDTADGLRCSSDACVALAVVGATCSYSSDCIRSAYCMGGHCANRVAAGAACTGSDSSECVAGYYCSSASPRQCTAQLANGATCTSNTMCASGSCSGSTCAPSFVDQLGWTILCM